MSKLITSPVKRWPGSVTLADPLSFPQVFAFEDALAEATKLGEDITVERQYYALLPGVCACVEQWNLDGLGRLTAETFPATPRKSATQLLSWLMEEVSGLFREAEEIPNG